MPAPGEWGDRSLPFGSEVRDFPDTPALARATDPETAHEAAAGVSATELEAIVLHDLRRRGPATTHELSDRMDRSLVSISPRMRPLEVKGLIVRDGKKANPSGRRAVIWAAHVQGGVMDEQNTAAETTPEQDGEATPAAEETSAPQGDGDGTDPKSE